MSGGHYDYGRAGIIGIGTPQANPTVEAETRILLPPNALLQTVRLTSPAPDALDRLREYLLDLPQTLARYDTLKPAAFGFGCTGSSYLVSPDAQAALVGDLQHRFGYPIVTATEAISWKLKTLGARRIALASPYPDALSEAAHAFWQAEGFDVAEIRQISTGMADTRGIYTLGSADARATAAELRATQVDAVLLSGTGMPSLKLVADSASKAGPPVISSNYCLALKLCEVAGIPLPSQAEWEPRLVEATTKPTGKAT